MKLITIIRSHGKLTNIRGATHSNKTIVKTDTEDEEINKITKNYPNAMVTVETIYDEKTSELFDIVYINIDNDSDDDSDDDDDGNIPYDPFVIDPDKLKEFLK